MFLWRILVHLYGLVLQWVKVGQNCNSLSIKFIYFGLARSSFLLHFFHLQHFFSIVLIVHNQLKSFDYMCLLQLLSFILSGYIFPWSKSIWNSSLGSTNDCICDDYHFFTKEVCLREIWLISILDIRHHRDWIVRGKLKPDTLFLEAYGSCEVHLLSPWVKTYFKTRKMINAP